MALEHIKMDIKTKKNARGACGDGPNLGDQRNFSVCVFHVYPKHTQIHTDRQIDRHNSQPT